MPKGRRKGSETGFYHVVIVGAGHQVMFEDDDDRWNFYRLMERLGDERVEFYAWCFMGNHVHLVLRSSLDDMARFMHRLEGIYARGFNDRHRRNGALFQHPYWSDPILTDERILATVRYIHRNPLKPKLARSCADYRWSSYREYVGTSQHNLVRTSFLLTMLGGVRAFEAFHEMPDDRGKYLDIDRVRIRRSNDQALALAHELIGAESLSNVAALSKHERDAKLRYLKENGLTLNQIAWMTGLGKSIVARA